MEIKDVVKVPFLDLSFQTQAILEEFLSRARDLACRNEFVGGEAIVAFEDAFARYCGSRFAVALNSGTDALRLALTASGLKAMDEVITSPFTFIATTEAISQTAKPVLADVDPETFNIHPETVEPKITERTRAVLPVHIFGLPAPMLELIFLAQGNRLIVIEDACQAHGSKIYNQRVGSFGQAAAFSFYPSKNLSAFGDAGALTTNDEAMSTRVKRLRNHGQVGHYQHEEEGVNSRMDALQSVVLDLKLRCLDSWNEQRRRLAATYREQLKSAGEVRFQREPENFQHVYHLLAARVQRREALIRHLAGAQIQTKIVYPTPVHLLNAYRHLNHRRGDFPNAEALCEEVLCFPLYPGMTEETVGYVAGAIRKFYGT